MEGKCSNTFTTKAASLSSNVTAYVARGDPPAMAFVLFCYVDLLLLFLLLGKFERLMGEGAGGSSEEKARVRAAVWALSASLVLVFGWRASSEIELWPVKLVIPAAAAAAAAVAGGGFCDLVLFC